MWNTKDNFVIGLFVFPLWPPTPFHIILLCMEKQWRMLAPIIANLCLRSF